MGATQLGCALFRSLALAPAGNQSSSVWFDLVALFRSNERDGKSVIPLRSPHSLAELVVRKLIAVKVSADKVAHLVLDS
jgi:hypothetical protein